MTSRPGLFPMRHVAAHAVIDRDAFIPNFYAFPFNGESVAFRHEVVGLVSRSSKDHVIFRPNEVPPPWRLLCEEYDVVLVAGEPEGLPDCAELLATAGQAALYRFGK